MSRLASIGLGVGVGVRVRVRVGVRVRVRVRVRVGVRVGVSEVEPARLDVLAQRGGVHLLAHAPPACEALLGVAIGRAAPAEDELERRAPLGRRVLR